MLVVMMTASLWEMSVANEDWGSGFNHTAWDWGPYHPPNQTEGPNKINVGGSENWHFSTTLNGHSKMVHSTSMIL